MKGERANAKALDVRLTTYEREVLRNYREAVRDIRADLGKLYERYADNGKLTYAEMSKYNRLAALEKQIVTDMGPALRKNNALIEKMSRVEYEEGFYRSAWAIDQNTGVALRWGQLNPATVQAAVANPLRHLAKRGLTQDGLRKVQRAVSQGLVRGLSYPNMMKGVKVAINGSASDALRVVRTEGQRAQVLGQQANYADARDMGVEVVDVWDAALDSRTRDSHGKLDGVRAKYRSNGEPYWDTDVGQVAGPLRSGVASFDINCRCRIRGEIEDFKPEKRRIKGEIQKYQTYKEWQRG